MIHGLRVAGLRRAYGEVPVLQGIDLDVPAGALTAVVGPSRHDRRRPERGGPGVEFFGPYAEVRLRAPDGTVLTARCPGPLLPAPGDRVGIRLTGSPP